MAKPNQISPGAFAVLPLPPLEYDVQWANQIVRILNLTQQQIQNPGNVKGNELQISDRDEDTQFIINPQELTETLTIIAKNLPTSSTGLVKDQLWNDAGTLKIVL
jgi:hypothetical protein